MIPGSSLDNAIIVPGKNATIDKSPTRSGASILIIVTLLNTNHDTAFTIVIIKPKKISKLKL